MPNYKLLLNHPESETFNQEIFSSTDYAEVERVMNAEYRNSDGCAEYFIETELNKIERLKKIKRSVHQCMMCGLSQTRKMPIVGVGDPYSKLMIIGDQPDMFDESTGKPFSGSCGEVLKKVIDSVGINDYFATYAVKCRPFERLKAEPSEIKSCSPYLSAQVSIIKPKTVLLLGEVALKSLMDLSQPIEQIRGKILDGDLSANPRLGELDYNVNVIPTYSPTFILENMDKFKLWKKDFYEARRLI